MKITRKAAGRTTTVTRYTGINTYAAHSFMVGFARDEAKGREDCREVKVEGGELSGRSRAKLIGHDGKTLATYAQVW